MRIPGKRIALSRDHLELMRVPRRFWRPDKTMVSKSIYGDVADYCRNMDEMLDRGLGYLWHGDNGVGKTFAAVIVLMEARRCGAPALFVTAETLRQASIDNTMFNEDMTVVERAQYVDFLLIDDFGKEHRTKSGYSERFFENLLRNRSADKKVTFITTNTPATKLIERYPRSLVEIIRECCYPVLVEGHNHRNDIGHPSSGQLAAG